MTAVSVHECKVCVRKEKKQLSEKGQMLRGEEKKKQSYLFTFKIEKCTLHRILAIPDILDTSLILSNPEVANL